MRVDRAFLFWLGHTDTCVASGAPSGGTHDIRFCAVAREVRHLLDGIVSAVGGIWRFDLAPYPRAGLPTWPLEIHDYRRTSDSRTECAMPRQFAGTPDAYPLWRMTVRVIPPGAEPQQAILVLRDTSRGLHARVVDEAIAESCPEELRAALLARSQCGRTVVLDPPWVFARFPLPAGAAPEATSETEEIPVDEWLEYVSTLGAPGDRAETTVTRRKRSEQLADAMKEHYSYRCQLCTDGAPTIDMGGGKLYVELHHIKGLAEVEAEPTRSDWCAGQDATPFNLDSYANVVVVCPYHHKLLHWYREPLRLDRRRRAFVAKDGSLIVPLVGDDHLIRPRDVNKRRRT